MDHQKEDFKNNKGSSSCKKDSDQTEKDADTGRSSSRIAKRLILEDVDKLADSFIAKFRNQLKIERQESFKRFREMIDRGL